MVSRATAESISSTSSLSRQLLALMAAATLAAGAGTAYVLTRSSSSPEVPTALATAPQLSTITALGRLEPQGEVFNLSASSNADGNRVDKLFVQEGDWVKTNQTIALLDSHDRLQAALNQAQEQVRVAQAKLATVKAGAKTGEIQAQKATISRLEAERETDIEAAQAVLSRLQAERATDIEAQQAAIARLQAERATDIEGQQATIARLQAEKQGDIEGQQAAIARLEAELHNAQTEAGRYQQLQEEGAISLEQLDSKRLTLETSQQKLKEAQTTLTRITSSREQQIKEAQAKLSQIQQSREQQIKEAQAKLNQAQTAKLAQITEAKATLDRITEVRPVDVQTAEAEVNAAIATAKQAEANLNLAYIRAPRDAQVLKIYAHPGERVGNDGIAQLGQTRAMYVVAEVYESDIKKVQVGQKAKITSTSFSEQLEGRVESIGLQVLKQNVINTDPSANIDGRIVEVRIRLNENSSQKVSGLTNLQVKVVIEQ
ncbi:MAG: hypothetical protein RLZZ338_1479 [Cyanobacteriota bacterium]